MPRDQIAPGTISQASSQAKSTRRLQSHARLRAVRTAIKKRGKMAYLRLFFRTLNDYAKGSIFVTREGRRQSAAPNQANDHGEIVVSGNSGVDIDVERLNSYRGQLGAYQHHAGASHGLLAPMTMAETTAAKPAARRAGSRISIVRLSSCVLLADSWGVALFSPARRRHGVGSTSAATMSRDRTRQRIFSGNPAATTMS